MLSRDVLIGNVEEKMKKLVYFSRELEKIHSKQVVDKGVSHTIFLRDLRHGPSLEIIFFLFNFILADFLTIPSNVTDKKTSPKT